MELTNLFTDEDAVSPVIGVILMVAITVILAAVVGAFVMGLGSDVGNAPSANIGFSYENPTTGNDNISIDHNGGDPLSVDSLSVKVDGTLVWENGGTAGSFSGTAAGWTSEVTAGDTLDLEEGTDAEFEDGDSVKVIWSAGEGGDTAVVGSGTVAL